MPKLTARKVETTKEPGMYGDGGGLYLNVAAGGTKSWILRTTVKGRSTVSGKPYRVEIGLGSTTLVSLAQAREASLPLRRLAREGINPLDERKKETLTFKVAAERVRNNLRPTWRSERHAEIWLAALERYTYPHFGNRPIETITSADILKALEPIWIAKHDTARRVLQRLTVIFDWAKSARLYPAENPVRGITKALPAFKPEVQHMASLPWTDIPDFMTQLREREGISARTLEFLILTAGRSGEVRGARWDEFDLAEKTWTVPAARMKTGKPHRVPLSDAALEVLKTVQGLDGSFVFPSPSRDRKGHARQQSDTVFKALMDRMKRTDLTTHGFRTTFRVWCAESAHADREVAEAALSHSVGNKVERAYSRSDLFDRRRLLMNAWGRFTELRAVVEDRE